jgi:polar amino acid transport system substrate-binding protein
MAEFLRLVADRRVRVAELVSARYPVERAPAAYESLTSRSAPPPVAVLLTYPTASALAAAPRVVAVVARGRGGAPAVSVIGAGAFARSVLLPRLRERGADLRVVVTATPASAEAAARRFGFVRAATDPVAAFEEAETEAVVIATRHDTHARLAVEALGAGKHVFLEKPMALSWGELKAVREAAASARRVFFVGYNRRFAPLAGRLREAVSGWGGPVAVIYRVNAGALPADHWTRDPRMGGGRIVGEACHFVDFIQYLTNSEPVEVMAYAVPPRDGGSPDTVTFEMRMADGSVGTVHYFALGDRGLAKERVEVFGAGGAAVLDDFQRLELYRGGRRQVVRSRAQDKGHTGELVAFLDAVAGRGAVPVCLESLVLTTATTFAAEEALRTGRPVAVRL